MKLCVCDWIILLFSPHSHWWVLQSYLTKTVPWGHITLITSEPKLSQSWLLLTLPALQSGPSPQRSDYRPGIGVRWGLSRLVLALVCPASPVCEYPTQVPCWLVLVKSWLSVAFSFQPQADSRPLLISHRQAGAPGGCEPGAPGACLRSIGTDSLTHFYLSGTSQKQSFSKRPSVLLGFIPRTGENPFPSGIHHNVSGCFYPPLDSTQEKNMAALAWPPPPLLLV